MLPWADYQALLEAAEDAIDGALLEEFRKKLASGEDETVPAVVVDALLAGSHPVKVWREYRGLTQDALATQAGISKAYLCQIETRASARGPSRPCAPLPQRLASVLMTWNEDPASSHRAFA